MGADLEPLHLTHIGAVVERSLTGTGAHPCHQHTYPFQLQSGVGGDGEYFQVGDWHDVYLNTQGGNPVMRFHPNKYTGKMMLHCHRLDHEDQGMMGLEWIHGGQCHFDSLFADFVDTDIIGNDIHLWTPDNTTYTPTQEVTTQEQTTPEPTTQEPTTEAPTTTSNCARSFNPSPIQADQTIRMLDSLNKNFCIFKKYSDFVVGDEI